MLSGNERRELSGGFTNTTNNRMEMVSIIEGLKALPSPDCRVVIYSDSRYVVDAYSNRKAHLWKSQNWMRTRKDKAKNPDLWDKLLTLCSMHDVKMMWVAGHSGNEHNERCDELAVAARGGDELLDDTGYGSASTEPPGQAVFDF
jgi:ribonuclease HI